MTENLIEKENKPALPVWARILLVIIAFIILTGIFQAIGLLISGFSFTEMSSIKDISQKQLLVLQSFGFIATVLIIYLFRKFIDKKSIESIGFSLKNRLADILAGFLIALIIIGGGSLILSVLNYTDFSFKGIDAGSLLLSLLIFIIVALNEEIFMRGYILNNLMSSMNKYLALIISAVIFSLMHAFNSGASLLPLINLVLAGIILGATYIFTQNLWFPISLHLFWNYFQGPVFGYSVSGQRTDSVFKTDLLGSTAINGGKFGFEGSIVCTIMLVIAIALILYFYNKNSLKQKDVL